MERLRKIQFIQSVFGYSAAFVEALDDHALDKLFRDACNGSNFELWELNNPIEGT